MPKKKKKKEGQTVLDEDGEDTGMTQEEMDDKKLAEKKEMQEQIKNVDVMDMAMQDLKQKKTEERDLLHEDLPSLAKMAMDWVLGRQPKRKPVWRTSRREELEHFIWKFKRLVPIPFAGDAFYYRRGSNRKLRYWGMRDPKKAKEGMGICQWPDPPHGGGESYFGMWRNDQPNLHGCFRWFDGDVYLGEWSEGVMQGYGIYAYGKHGQYANDRYEGGYFANMRQGSGIYFYAGDEGGIYMGEWLRGKMHGHGLIVYPDGEYYLGKWKHDMKDGRGVYVWGKSAGDVAGDKYEGQFREGMAHGSGRTIFSDGGWHKGRYSMGKMQGHGMMMTAEGWEYIGFWRQDEIHGECVCNYVYGATDGVKTVQTYNNGDLVSEREFDPEHDWVDIESIGRSEKNNADKEAEEVLLETKKTSLFVKKAKQSQHMAREAAEEARFYVRNSLDLKETLLAWFGLKHKLFPPDVD